jgi:two-component system sensor histidine kinase VicK
MNSFLESQSAEVISTFVKVIREEFEIPLTSISYNIQAIKRLMNVYNGQINENEPLKYKVECIEGKTNQMCRLLEQILDLARTELAEMKMKKNLAHTHDLISDVMNNTKKLSLKLSLHQDSLLTNEYCTIACDKDRLIQVFISVIANLNEMGGSSSNILLSTKVNGNFVQFLIKDESCLLSPNEMLQIFDKFTPLKFHSSERVGLGLALSKRIIEAHSGKIWLESAEDKGTIFFIELPRMGLEELKATLSS